MNIYLAPYVDVDILTQLEGMEKRINESSTLNEI